MQQKDCQCGSKLVVCVSARNCISNLNLVTAVLFKLNWLQYEFQRFCIGVAEDSVLLGYDMYHFERGYCLPFQVLLSSRFI
jgi:hypothetical protein